MKQFLRRFVWWTRRQQKEEELREEIQFHLEAEVEDLADPEQSQDEAQREARRSLGNLTLLKEDVRASWGWTFLERLSQDLRYGFRLLRENPALSFVIIISLAIGIGANTALYSLVDGMFFRELPVNSPDRLVSFEWRSEAMPSHRYSGNSRRNPDTRQQEGTSFPYGTFERFRSQSQTLAEVFAIVPRYQANVQADGRADIAQLELVSGNYFAGVGTTAFLGRTLTGDDDRPSAEPVAVISYRYWQRRFGEDPAVVGKKARINKVPVTIVGVTPPGFEGIYGFGASFDVSVPLAHEPQFGLFGGALTFSGEPAFWWVLIMGRMKPGVEVEHVRAELENVFRNSALDSWTAGRGLQNLSMSARTFPEVLRLQVTDGSRGFTYSLRQEAQLLPILAGVFGLLLLVVCVNVSSLMLARATAREREMGIRLAIGSTRGRLIRQLLTESLLLTAIAGVVGVLLAVWGKDVVPSLLPRESTPTLYDLRIDLRILGFASMLSLVTGILFGLAPALRSTCGDLNRGIKQKSRSIRNTPSLLARGLVVVQVAMSVVLLVGAGVLLASLHNLSSVDAGFDIDNILLFRLDPGSLEYDKPRLANLYQRALDKIGELPGVLATTTSAFPLVSSAGNSSLIFASGLELDTRERSARLMGVRSNFFETMGIQVLRGRGLNAGDGPNSPPVAVINETAARRFFPDSDPVGKRLGFVPESPAEIEVVGIIEDIHTSAIRQDIPPVVYFPDVQRVPSATTFAVRTRVDPLAMVPAIRQAVNAVDPNVPMFDIKTQVDQVRQGFAMERGLAQASALFTLIAVVLVGIGLYALLSFTVARQTNEIGLRLALGALPWHIMRRTASQSGRLVGLGIFIGIAIAYLLVSALKTILFGLEPQDPFIMTLAIAVIVVVAALATYFPAKRAAGVDPLVALRHE